MTSPLPGNLRAIANERDRLAGLADLLEDGSQVLHSLRTESWTGPSAEGFDDIRRAQVRTWAQASDSHRAVADALDRFAQELAELQRLAESVLADAQKSGNPILLEAAHQSIERWRQQAEASAATCAQNIQQATAALRGTPRSWPSWSPDAQHAPFVLAPTGNPTTAKPGRHRAIAPADYRSAHRDRDVRELTDAVFRRLRG